MRFSNWVRACEGLFGLLLSGLALGGCSVAAQDVDTQVVGLSSEGRLLDDLETKHAQWVETLPAGAAPITEGATLVARIRKNYLAIAAEAASGVAAAETDKRARLLEIVDRCSDLRQLATSGGGDRSRAAELVSAANRLAQWAWLEVD